MVALRGLARSLTGHFGFEPRNGMLLDTDLNMAGYHGDAAAMQKRMVEAMQNIPGVASASLLDFMLLNGGINTDAIFPAGTIDLRAANAAAHAVVYKVSPDYFRTAGTAILAGRDLTWHDDGSAPRVAVVNREFARRIFGSMDKAMGGQFKLGNGWSIRVAGIVEDGKYGNLAEEPRPAMFLPILQSPSTMATLVVRSTRDPRRLAPAMRTALRDLDPGLPCFIETWTEQLSLALFPSRMATISLGVLGLMGAILSITGIFGMAAYSVSRRLRELGIRLALGARRAEILRTALSRSMKLLAFGSAAGLILGILASRILAAIVYHATPRDPLVLAGAILAMALVGLLAAWIPARRALSLDPVTLLREE